MGIVSLEHADHTGSKECSMSLDVLFLIVLIVILRRVIPGVAARLGLGLRAIPPRPFDHRRHSLMLRGYL
jgi:hypothetical protein